MYKVASAMSTQILHQVPQAEFWDKSYFNQQCPAKLINFCQDLLRYFAIKYFKFFFNYLIQFKPLNFYTIEYLLALSLL